MDKLSSASSIAITAGAGAGVAMNVPLVTWVISGCPQPVPPDVAAAIAAYAAAGIHFVALAAKRVMTRFFPNLAAGAKPLTSDHPTT